jgi:hypothetical protein
MGFGIKDIIKGAIEPVTGLINNMHTSDEEKRKIQLAMDQLVNTVTTQLINAQGNIIKAEAESEHWLTSTWRPITALVFVAIIANNYIIAPYTGAFFGTSVTLEIPPEMWELLKIMIGGYVVSRGVEKGIDKYKGNR